MAEPLLAALPPHTGSVALVAAGPLGLLPLHAAWTQDPERPTGRRYLTDHCAISYQPNARILARPPQAPDRLLAVTDPDGSLPSARHELTAIAGHFRDVTRLLGPDATKEAVVTAMPGADVHHFACHGYARPSAPLESAVVLSDAEPLTLRDLLALRLTARLAVLSACQTQVPGHALPDELISMPTALLEAGVRGVIASQWEVSGLATVLLMTRFYRYWLTEGQPPGRALQLAQIWLRDTTNAQKVAELHPISDRWARRHLLRSPPDARGFGHPSIWAAFSHTGA
jgi:CHAT domain-containing protein